MGKNNFNEGFKRVTMRVVTSIISAILVVALLEVSQGDEITCPGQVCYETNANGTIVEGGNKGCCVKRGLECCPDGLYCVRDATKQCTDNGSPPKKYKNKDDSVDASLTLTERKTRSLKDTKCPAGTCEVDNWFCCPDNIHCAETEAHCPNFQFHKSVK